MENAAEVRSAAIAGGKARPACKQARHAEKGNASLPDDWERGTFLAGAVFAASFGLMFLHAGMML